jgi:hypothetical protein
MVETGKTFPKPGMLEKFTKTPGIEPHPQAHCAQAHMAQAPAHLPFRLSLTSFAIIAVTITSKTKAVRIVPIPDFGAGGLPVAPARRFRFLLNELQKKELDFIINSNIKYLMWWRFHA